VLLSSSAFDFMGVSAATCAYVTARDLTSDAAFYNLTFNLSRSTAGADAAYNLRAVGADAGLSWEVATFKGAFGGEAFDGDPNGRVSWGQELETSAPAAIADLLAAPGASYGSISLSWTSSGDDGASGPLDPGVFRVFYSTRASDLAAPDPGFAQVVLATSSVPGSLQSLSLEGLLTGASYYFRLWIEDDSSNLSPLSNGATAQAFHPLPQPPSLGVVVFETQVTLAWTAPAVPPAAYLDRYELSYSSVSSAGP
jgi:hypothetical protein